MERFGLERAARDRGRRTRPQGDRRSARSTGSSWRGSRSQGSARSSSELHEYTVDALEAAGYEDPVFLIGADELAGFPTWKEPERVLELARLGVATRPGYRPEATSPRIEIFELEPYPVSSSEIRERVRRGEPIDGLVAGRRSPRGSPSSASTGTPDSRVSRLH